MEGQVLEGVLCRGGRGYVDVWCKEECVLAVDAEDGEVGICPVGKGLGNGGAAVEGVFLELDSAGGVSDGAGEW